MDAPPPPAPVAGGGIQPLVPRSHRLNELVQFGPHYYHRVKTLANGTVYLVCNSCHTGTAIMRNGVVEAGHKEHAQGCNVDMSKYAKKEFRQLAKRNFARSSAVTTQHAHQEATAQFVQQYGPAHNHNIPLNRVRSSLYQARAETIPVIPHTYDEIPPMEEFPEQYTHMKDNPDEQFLFVNSVFHENQRILAFTTRHDLQLLAAANHVYMDGTFKVTPEPFQQLFTMNTMMGPSEDRSVLIPRIYFLLPGKSEAVYSEMFDLTLRCIEVIREQFNEGDGIAHWERFSCDFEAGLIAAVRNAEFDPHHQIVLEGCHYHFCAAVYRKLVEAGAFSMYQDYHDPNSNAFKQFIQKLFALHFLPADRVAACFQQLILNDAPANVRNTARFAHFIDYFANQWVFNEVNRDMVNLYNRAGRRRTNNNIEGWHNKARHELQEHSNLWVFIERLQNLHKDARQLEEDILTDPLSAIRLREPGQRHKEEGLKRLQDMYLPGGGQFLSDIVYIRRVAHSMNVF